MSAATAAPSTGGGFAALRVERFRLWLLGTFFSSTGEWSQRTAQDWIVLTQLTDHSAAATGATVSLQYLPVLLFGPYAGVLADKLPRRRLLTISQSVFAVNSLTMCVLVVTHTATLWMVMCSAFVLGCGSALDLPSRQAFVGDLVPRETIMSAVGNNGAVLNLGRMTGPAVAGVVIGLWGTGQAFAVTTLGAAAALTVLVALGRRGGLDTAPRPRQRVTVREVLGYVRGRRDLAILLVGTALVSMFAAHSALTTALMATSVYHRGSSLYGVVAVMIASGSVIGSVLAARRARPRLGHVCAGGLGLSVALLASSVMPTFGWYALTLVPLGTFIMTYFISTQSALQVATEPHLRGRVLALFSAVQMGAMSIGSSALGAIGQAFGAPWAVRAGALAALTAAAVVYLGAVRRPRAAAAFAAAVARHITPLEPLLEPAPNGAFMSVTARYADPRVALAVTSETLELQLAHRSVRQFLPDPVPDAQLRAIVAAAQSAATSSNLQSWSVVAVRDPERKARLARLANGQQFIDDAPLFLVWVADLGRAHRLAERSGAPLEGAAYLEATILAFVDAALAAQNAVVAAESLGLGTVYVGAIRNHPEDVATELGLPPRTVATFGLAVGVADPTENAGVKPRLPQDAVLHLERYDAPVADAGIPAYDERLARFNSAYGLTGNWSERVLARLADAPSLHGRDKLREALERRGFPSR